MICLAEPKPRLLAQTQENLENDVPPWHKRRQSVILALWQLEKRVWTVGVRPAEAGSRTVLYHNKHRVWGPKDEQASSLDIQTHI